MSCKNIGRREFPSFETGSRHVALGNARPAPRGACLVKVTGEVHQSSDPGARTGADAEAPVRNSGTANAG